MDVPELQDSLFNLSQEVIADPIPFVALCGLDATNNATHRIIWDTFVNNRTADRLPIAYRALPADYEFPTSKIKKSYEYGTIPGGILKRNWIRKHMYEVPALVVLFADLEWDDPAFAEKRITCSSKIATIRASLVGRNVRIALVLIQSRPHTFAPGEASPDTEKITSMCNACELGFKQLFLLPNNENLSAYIIRLETALFEMVQQYYLNEAKRVRGHRDAVMRMQSLNLPLLVRHQFKIAYFNEFRQDRQTALKHYQQAYANLQQIRQDGGFEVKTVAMIINYRICRLSFKLACPVDAIANFRKHLEIFRLYKGPPDLAYQHEAWLFRQNFVFATAFDEAIQAGLSAIPSENPGIYFTKAADHMKLRQTNCRNFPAQQNFFQPAPPTEGEFYGQLILSVPSSAGDMPIALYLQNCERAVNHTGWMIHLLSSAITQFKKHRCNKTALILYTRLGDEYCDLGMYEKAMMLYSQALMEYRKSKWSSVFNQLLLRQMKVAALVPNISEFIQACLEVMSEILYLPLEDRSHAQELFYQITSGKSPDFRNLLGPQSQLAYQKWTSLPPEALRFTLDMDHLKSCIDVSCHFPERPSHAHNNITLNVRIRVTSPLPVTFTELRVILTNPAHSPSLIKDSSRNAEDLLEVASGHDKVVVFTIHPRPEDVGNILSVAKICLKVGSSVFLLWSDLGSRTKPKQALLNGSYVKLWDADQSSYEASSVEILRRPAALDIIVPFSKPILVGETYKLNVSLKSRETTKLTKLHLGIVCDEPGALGKFVFAPTDAAVFMNESTVQLKDLAPDEELRYSFLVRCSGGLKAKIRVFASYEIEEAAFKCVAECSGVLESVNPLQIRFMSKEFNSEEYPSEKHVIPAGEDFIYFMVIRNVSPIRISLGTPDFKFSETALSTFIPFEPSLNGLSLGDGEEAQDVVFLHVNDNCLPGSSVSMGPLILKWNRIDSDQPEAVTFIPVPDLLIKASQSPINISLSFPSKVVQFEPLNLLYKILNNSDQLMDIHVILSTNDEYVLAGEKETKLRLGPKMETLLHASIVPINVGYMRLPDFELRCNNDLDCRDWIDSHLPKTVFVMPKDLPSDEISPVCGPLSAMTASVE